MGAWGIGNFENDEAMDWIYELEDSKDFAVLERALKAVTRDESGAADIFDASAALAAAEVVAALLGFPPDDLPEEVESWIDGKPEPPNNLVALAQRAVEAVKQKSELRDLWEESESLDEWTEVLNDTQSRLT